jgi:hypothetical protein
LGAVASAFMMPRPYGFYVAAFILILALVLFGGFFLWRRWRAKRQAAGFGAAVEAQAAAAPKTISDPDKRAKLDQLRQKFQKGLQEYKSRGKDIYKLPWYVIIGESGSGKSEAIRHSQVDFPPGLQDELQGSGGTVNMDWWFTNRGIILDTAGSMLFNETRTGESAEWKEFLRLLKRARPHCPINGLLLVLSVESLIKDSADVIAQKSGRIAQQLDLIQRTLDVRFPVYLVVTKCDLLTGFREFFDSEDPDFQYQIFGWSNPDPLDAHFRPDLVEQHLRGVAARLRRRRMAMLRDTGGGGRIGDTQQFFASSYQMGRVPGTAPRRLDEVDSMFAFTESLLRLAPRLRRYLETIFVSGEWSSKPVFLRGIYFNSSMRKGKALDEALALATGLGLDAGEELASQEENRAFFLRDLFMEKVFRESGLVTRATNTLNLLRKRQLIIFGSATVALLLVLVFGYFANQRLKESVKSEADYWKAGTNDWKDGVWTAGAIVKPGAQDPFHYTFAGSNLVNAPGKLNLVQYHRWLKDRVTNDLAVSFIFKPMQWVGAGKITRRPEAQRILFEGSVVKPLVDLTRNKMISQPPPANAAALARHGDALMTLLELEADALAKRAALDTNQAQRYLVSLLAYLTEGDFKGDPELAGTFARTYAADALKRNNGTWPPARTALGGSLTNNPAIATGLEKFQQGSLSAQTTITDTLKQLDSLVDGLANYQRMENEMLGSAGDPCPVLAEKLAPAIARLTTQWQAIETLTNLPSGGGTNYLAAKYQALAARAEASSAKVLAGPVSRILSTLPPDQLGQGLFKEVQDRLKALAAKAADSVQESYKPRQEKVADLDASLLLNAGPDSVPAYQTRWALYSSACSLASQPGTPAIGEKWKSFGELKRKRDDFNTKLADYKGPLGTRVSAICGRIAGEKLRQLETTFVATYDEMARQALTELTASVSAKPEKLAAAREGMARIQGDLDACAALGDQQSKLDGLREAMGLEKSKMLQRVAADLSRSLGFPLALNAEKALPLEQIQEVRKQLRDLNTELGNAAWQGAKSETLAQVQKASSSIERVANGLVKDDGTVAEFELFYVPPSETSPPEARLLASIFRKVRVNGGAGGQDDLSAADANNPATCRLGSFSLDSKLSLQFYRRVIDTQVAATRLDDLKEQPWALLRLMQADVAKRSEDGRKWRFAIPLEDQGKSGTMTFEAVLDPKRLLPKGEDWPKAN